VYLRPVAFKDAQIIGVRLHDVSNNFLLTSEPMGNYVDIGGLRCGVPRGGVLMTTRYQHVLRSAARMSTQLSPKARPCRTASMRPLC